MRADAFVTLNLVEPVRRLFPPKGRRVPILMYHSISDREERGHPYFRTVTSPKVFAMHMRYLKDRGYMTVGVADALEYIDGKKESASQPVVITFDDGYQDFYTHAWPVLAAHGFTATMFLATAYIGGERLRLNGNDCMNWDEVRELNRAGVEFGSHTATHPKLIELGPREIELELRSSRETIEDKLGRIVRSFAYPYAFPESASTFVACLRRILQKCAYQIGVSTVIGRATKVDDPLFLRRLPMNSSDDTALFRAKLEGGYDWLRALQRMKKVLASSPRNIRQPTAV